MVRQPGIEKHTTPITQLYKDACATGRLRITSCNIEGRCLVYVINIYGWSNGHHCTVAASRTNALVIAAKAELRAQSPPPSLISGDINAEAADLPALLE